MMRRLAVYVVIALTNFADPRPASAEVGDVYDTVDSAEIDGSTSGSRGPTLVITGIPERETTPVTRSYHFTFGTPTSLDTAMHCHRLAVLAMSKPGKFQFAIGAIRPGEPGPQVRGCKLSLRAP